jgi:hypothetical protein
MQSPAENRKLNNLILLLSWLLTIRKLEVIFLLVDIRCRWCGINFYICRRCWRGQAYCSQECRLLGRCRIHREAQRRYRQTQKGQKAHRHAENRRRHELNQCIEKKMDDPSSRGLAMSAKEIPVAAHVGGNEARRCHFCGRAGRVVDRFPRRE